MALHIDNSKPKKNQRIERTFDYDDGHVDKKNDFDNYDDDYYDHDDVKTDDHHNGGDGLIDDIDDVHGVGEDDQDAVSDQDYHQQCQR